MKLGQIVPAAMAFAVLAACGGSKDKPEAETTAAATESETADAIPVNSAETAAARIKADMAYLADDVLEGREAGTPGYDKAADYVAAQLEAIGVKPAGTDGYFQPIEFSRGYRQPDATNLTVTNADGTDLGLEKNVDYVVYGSSSRESASVEGAELVFVGYGLVAPELGRDDYAGLDVEGKIIVTLTGTPDGIQTEERAYYGAQKSRWASERGAIGSITIETPTRNRIYSFKRLVTEGRLESASLTWLTESGEGYSNSPNLRIGAYLSEAGARKLFANAPAGYDEIIAKSEENLGPVEGFPLDMTVDMSTAATIDQVTSANVIGVIEGSDPALKGQYIVLTAHLDHIGVSRSMEDDKINNGALDNAAGVATLLEVARTITGGEPPRRSILLVIVTAEEKGLLGAEYFARNPTVPAEAMVANVNLDMPVLTYDFTDVVAFGSDRSTIADAVSAAANEMGMTLAADPFPDQGLFTRSDHYRFVEIGVPSVFLATGFANGGEEAWATHFAQHYHRPADDMNNALNFDAAARFAEVNTKIAMTLANADERPLWVKDDFFARAFDGPQAE